MLILKLIIVPLALLALGIMERLHGPRVAGWLSGFPVVGGPLLVFITLDHGPGFGAAAALGAYFGLVPWLAFTMTYAWCARALPWFWCMVCGYVAWTLVAVMAVAMQSGPKWLEILPLLAFLGGAMSYPRGEPSDEQREHVWWGLPARMIAGAMVVLLISHFAANMGTSWSGLLATFPVMGSVIAISNHVQYGRRAVQEAVAGMTVGLASVGLFCFAASQMLGRMEVWAAFTLSLVLSTTAHGLTWLVFKTPKRKPS